MAMRKIAPLLVLLFACSPGSSTTSSGGNEAPYGGDILQMRFLEARTLAESRVRAVTECAISGDADAAVREWIIAHRQDLAREILFSRHRWTESPLERCAGTANSKGADIELSYSSCEGYSSEDAAALLIHEAVHHLQPTARDESDRAAQEAHATAVAREILRAGPGNCIPTEDEIVWIDRDLRRWKIADVVESVDATREKLCVRPKALESSWPEFAYGDLASGGFLSRGNFWIVAYVDDRWRAGTFEWITAEQLPCLGDTPDQWAGSMRDERMRSWAPKIGETIGVMVSTWVRDGHLNGPRERSRIFWIRWP